MARENNRGSNQRGQNQRGRTRQVRTETKAPSRGAAKSSASNPRAAASGGSKAQRAAPPRTTSIRAKPAPARSNTQAKPARANTQASKPKVESQRSSRRTVATQGNQSNPRFSSGTNTPSGGSSPVRGRSVGKVRGMTLRSKLMLAMAGMTAATMVVLGLTLTTTANSYLFGQAQHKGVEVGKMVAQIGRSVMDRHARDGFNSIEERDALLQKYLRDAVTWGDEFQRYSDIVAITFSGGSISGQGLGEMPDARMRGTAYPQVNIPRLGWVSLPDDIQVAETTRAFQDRESVPVFRFKVNLNTRWDATSGAPSSATPSYLDSTTVWVDLAADKVHAVRNNLFMIIGIAVAVSLMVVLFIANWMARSITRPVHILLRDMDHVAKGDLNHNTRSHSSDEVGLLANAFNLMTKDLKVAQDAMLEQEKTSYELSLAKEVQAQLLPSAAPEIPGYEPFAYYKGAKAVSGDCYDFIPLGDGLWGFIIADVSGKGIPGSMVMAVTRTIVRLVAHKHRNRAAEALKETNRLIAKQIKRGMFVTAFYALLDEKSGALTYSSAGHNPMLIYRAASRTHELAAPKGIAIGFNEGPLFDKNIQEFQTILHPGDAMVMYTDGFPEAMDENNEEYGDDRFYAMVGATVHLGSEGMVNALVDEIAKHRGKAAQSDDLTLLTVRRNPA